jgi:NADPH-dependent ferric siderophore reductase
MSATAATAVRRTPLHEVRVTAVLELTPRMRRVTVAGPSLTGLVVAPAQDIEVVLPDGSGHRVKRRYTIRSARPDAGEIDIDVLVHPHGPGGRWADAVAAGDDLSFFGPRGHLEVLPADWHLFIGDEAGVPAIAAVIEALPAGEAALVLAEVGDESDELPWTRAAGDLAVTWLHRGDTSPGTSDLFASAVGALAMPVGSARAYLLGESRAMVGLRPALARLGIEPGDTYLKGYWNRGR